MSKRVKALLALTLSCMLGGAFAQQRIDPAIYAALERAQQAQRDGREQDALATLQTVRGQARSGSLEAALIDQRLAYLSIDRNRPEEAIELLQRALDSGALTVDAAAQDRRNLAQLLVSQDRFAEAIDLLEAEQQRSGLSLPLKRLLVQAYSEAQQYGKAVGLAEQVIRAEPDVDDVWYRLLAGMNHRLERYAEAERWLQALVTREPANTDYWRQLAAVQSLDRRQLAAAATLRLAYEGGVRLDEQDLQNLVSMQVQAGAPWQAARLLQALLEERLLANTERRQQWLAQLWSQARDRERAEAAWRALANRSGQTAHWLRVAGIQLDQQQWAELLATLERAGSGDDAEQAKLIQQWRAYAQAMQSDSAQ